MTVDWRSPVAECLGQPLRHQVLQRQGPYREHNRPPLWSLHHAQPPAPYCPNRASERGFRANGGYRVDEVQSMAHRECTKRPSMTTRFEWRDEFVDPHRPIAFPQRG